MNTEDTKLNKFAVIKLKGTQYIIEEGKKYTVEKLGLVNGTKLEITDVLLVADGEDVKVGKPYVKDAKVVVEVVANKKLDKLTTFTFAAKSRYRKTSGSRREATVILVKSI